jgi:hypothetical protein
MPGPRRRTWGQLIGLRRFAVQGGLSAILRRHGALAA